MRTRDAALEPLLELIDRQEGRMQALEDKVQQLTARLDQMDGVLAQMSTQGLDRDRLINNLSQEVTRHNGVFDEMTRQNHRRDEALRRLGAR